MFTVQCSLYVTVIRRKKNYPCTRGRARPNMEQVRNATRHIESKIKNIFNPNNENSTSRGCSTKIAKTWCLAPRRRPHSAQLLVRCSGGAQHAPTGQDHERATATTRLAAHNALRCNCTPSTDQTRQRAAQRTPEKRGRREEHSLTTIEEPYNALRQSCAARTDSTVHKRSTDEQRIVRCVDE